MQKASNTIKTSDLIIKPQEGFVEVNGKVVRLGPVNMKVLVELVKHKHHVVTREALFETVWKNQIVSDDALTRCISDLRNKLVKFSKEDKLIITIPKKGYQWSPSIDLSKQSQPTLNKKPQTVKGTLVKLAGITLTLFILTTSLLWLANKYFRVNHIPLLLIPIESSTPKTNDLALNIEQSLRKTILETDKIRFLSNSVLSNKNNYSLLNLNNQYGIQWAIEARISQSNHHNTITLNLIDARTSLELFSKSYLVQTQQNHIKTITSDFIQIINTKILN